MAKRVGGLDTLRALAIALVFAFHYQVFVSHAPTFGWASRVGWTGVDLFFVLSGYLIANGIFSGMVRGEKLSLKAFYARRFLRTLPNYLVVLALYFLFPALFGAGVLPPLWRFLTFTQNYRLAPGTGFSHAWSLCIEEQFYLLLPALSILAVRYVPEWGRWLFLGLCVAAGITLRSLLWQYYGREPGTQGYYPNIYYSSFCRADEFLPGVAIAALKSFQPAAWSWLMSKGRWLTGLGIGAVAAAMYGVLTAYQIDGYGYGYFMTGFGYSLIAWAFGVLVLAALCPDSILNRVTVPGARRLALWSYAIYLSHKPIAAAVSRVLEGRGVELESAVAIGTIGVACLVGGWALFTLVETPFMKLRDRWAPSSFA